MEKSLSYCCNCAPEAAQVTAQFPFLCTLCQTYPQRINLLDACRAVSELRTQRQLPYEVQVQVVEYLCRAVARCVPNAVPVVVGIVLTELYEDGGTVLMVERPAAAGWGLVYGPISEQCSWQENLRNLARAEASVTLDVSHMDAFCFTNDASSTAQVLNFAVVYPSGVVRINDFLPIGDSVARKEFSFSKRGELPPFASPTEARIFAAWCDAYFRP
jgi:hypothetical protein